MTAFDTQRPTTATPDMSTSALTGARRIRVRVTRTRVIETTPVPYPSASDTTRPSAFTRTRFLSSLKDFAGLAVLGAGGYVCALVV